jgi:hypothetical protein
VPATIHDIRPLGVRRPQGIALSATLRHDGPAPAHAVVQDIVVNDLVSVSSHMRHLYRSFPLAAPFERPAKLLSRSRVSRTCEAA